MCPPNRSLAKAYDAPMSSPEPNPATAMWDERYRTEGYVFGTEPNRFVVEHLSGLPPGRALDLGSGQGRNAVWLARHGHRVTAVDLSPVAGEQARRLAAEAGVTIDFVTADLSTWQPERSKFDLVLLSYLQLDQEWRRTVHRGAADALAPGGIVLLIAHHRDNLEHGVGGPQRPDLLFTEEELRADFASLSIERLERVMRPVTVDGTSRSAVDIVMIGRCVEDGSKV